MHCYCAMMNTYQMGEIGWIFIFHLGDYDKGVHFSMIWIGMFLPRYSTMYQSSEKLCCICTLLKKEKKGYRKTHGQTHRQTYRQTHKGMPV